MDAFVRTSSFEPSLIVSDYSSFIWTERFNRVADFELTIPLSGLTDTNRRRLGVGNYIHIQNSDVIMRIGTTNVRENEEGEQVFIATGEDVLGYILKNRGWIPFVDGEDYIIYDRSATSCVNFMVRYRVEWRPEAPTEAIWYPMLLDNFWTATFRFEDEGGDDDPGAEIIVEPGSLYSRITELLDMDNSGFRLDFLKEPDSSGRFLYFSTYSGVDRRSNSNASQTVTFSTTNDLLHNTEFLTTDSNFKNVAWAVDGLGNRLRVGTFGSNPMNARVLPVLATDINEYNPKALAHRAREELSQHKRRNVLDGDINLSSVFTYKGNYDLGDIVSLQHENFDVSSCARIIEYTRVLDRNGYREFPTLEMIED